MPRTLRALKVVLVTPNAADSDLASAFLAAEGVAACVCPNLASLAAIPTESIGCILLVEEALTEPDIYGLRESMRRQPTWSDLPILLVAGEATPLSSLVEAVYPESGNITLLQRPLHPVSFISAVNVALRARERQLQVRDLLAQQQRAVTRRDEFLAMLAHELRNPLAPIRNAVYLMGKLPYDDPVFLKCRAMIDKQAGHITRLVDDLLDVSRLELGKVELRLQRLNLNDAVAATAEACMPTTNAHRHAVTVRVSREPLWVVADAVRLEQAIGNLILNAAKFTQQGGTIVVETARDGEFGVVSVTDNGMGIKPEMLDSIFELFTQDQVTLARTEGGLGIGLTLVRRLVELHRGSVRATSAGLGMGARFEARLPLVSENANDERPAGTERTAMQSKRVLIVEDGDDTRESLGMLVAAWSHEVIYATNGPEAVVKARESQPDVALVDIGLPGFDGYEVARHIRREGTPWARHLTLIAVTGYGQEADRNKAYEAGFDKHLLKPVDPDQLEAMLATPRS
jgi:signal transduction histidine kinase/CheY-like chemotaxis protein